jgi:phosphate transport system substrate-binding protein
VSVKLLFIFLSLILFSVTSLAEAAVTLNWVGCGISKKAYVADLSKAFGEKTGIHINVQGGGATKGIRKVVSGEADLGGSCRYQLPNDPREAGVGLEPVAWDALVVITHKDNVVDSLSLVQVHDIYLGKITNWKEVGGSDAAIEVFTRKSKFSGVGRTLRKLLFSDFDQELTSSQAFKSSGPLEKAVIKSPNAIAITGISSARLRDIKIQQLAGIAPTYDNIKAGKYQMYRPLYITYNPGSEKIAEVKKFISFTHSAKGRKIMRDNGTLPYLEGVPLISLQIQQELSAFRQGAEISVDTNQ